MESAMRQVRKDRQREAEAGHRGRYHGVGRPATDYSLEACAKVLGVSKPTYVKFEHDPDKMRVGQAKRLAEHLGVSVEAIIC